MVAAALAIAASVRRASITGWPPLQQPWWRCRVVAATMCGGGSCLQQRGGPKQHRRLWRAAPGGSLRDRERDRQMMRMEDNRDKAGNSESGDVWGPEHTWPARDRVCRKCWEPRETGRRHMIARDPTVPEVADGATAQLIENQFP